MNGHKHIAPLPPKTCLIQSQWEQRTPLNSFVFFKFYFLSTGWLLSKYFTLYLLLPKQLWWNFNRSIHCTAKTVSLPRPQQGDNTVYSVLTKPVKIGQVTAQSELCQYMCKLLHTHPHKSQSQLTHSFAHTELTALYVYSYVHLLYIDV